MNILYYLRKNYGLGIVLIIIAFIVEQTVKNEKQNEEFRVTSVIVFFVGAIASIPVNCALGNWYISFWSFPIYGPALILIIEAVIVSVLISIAVETESAVFVGVTLTHILTLIILI